MKLLCLLLGHRWSVWMLRLDLVAARGEWLPIIRICGRCHLEEMDYLDDQWTLTKEPG
jgi:hypothetical protein